MNQSIVVREWSLSDKIAEVISRRLITFCGVEFKFPMLFPLRK